MLSGKLRSNPGRFRAIIYAVLVHAVVIGLAVIGFRWTMAPSTDQVIQAVAVPEQAARKPEVADKRAKEEEEARKKAEAEKRRQAELKKKQEEEQAQQRLVAERKKKEAEEKEQQKRAELERKNEDMRRQKLTEQSLQEQLAMEEKQRADAAKAARAATIVDKYIPLIRQRVSRSWNSPVGIAKGLKCVVRVRLTTAGEVLSAAVVGPSGNERFDRSVENAVHKAAPLPLPDDPALFDNFREIEFVFDPDKEQKR